MVLLTQVFSNNISISPESPGAALVGVNSVEKLSRDKQNKLLMDFMRRTCFFFPKKKSLSFALNRVSLQSLFLSVNLLFLKIMHLWDGQHNWGGPGRKENVPNLPLIGKHFTFICCCWL